MQNDPATPQTSYAPTYSSQGQSPVISLGEWMVTLLLLAIPVVNIIMMLVWAFGGGANPNKRNLMRAYLIWLLIIIAIYVILAAALGAMFLNFMGDFGGM